MKIKRISFSLLLPIIVVAAWILLMPFQTGLLYYRLYNAAQGTKGVSIQFNQFKVTVHRNQFLTFAFNSVVARNSDKILAANLPGLFLDVLVSLPTSHRLKWHPASISLKAWRSLTLPFYCLPIWWFVGCGLEGLCGRRRLNRVMLVTGSILLLLCLVIWVGIGTASASERADMTSIIHGVILWTAAFGLFPLTWICQKITGKEQSKDIA